MWLVGGVARIQGFLQGEGLGAWVFWVNDPRGQGPGKQQGVAMETLCPANPASEE